MLRKTLSGKGMGRKLCDLALSYLEAAGTTHCKITATRTAKTFYESMGFRASKGESLLAIRGTSLECYQMTQKLPQTKET